MLPAGAFGGDDFKEVDEFDAICQVRGQVVQLQSSVCQVHIKVWENLGKTE